ncbi:MAG: hypothetical protein PHU31_00555 [Anaerotignum sp.]|nr:hypothetical protein [Anaerotignum sp.]
MDKKTNNNTNNNTQGAQKNVNRTEFAQEYSIDTGSQSARKCDKTNKTNKTNKLNNTK